MTYDEAMDYIGSFSRSGAPVTDLSRIAALLHRLGDPQDALQFVHIAGTNGKGSLAEYLTGILRCAGYRTGTFTSPYIRRYRDRIRLDGKDIPEEALCRLCDTVRAAAGEAPYSQFELTFAIALCYYREVGAQIVVLETGIGGTLDATNIIAPPLACVITSVSLDHTALLGTTLEEIARHKAGIIKPGSTAVVSADNRTSVLELMEDTARAQGCDFRVPDTAQCVTQAVSLTGNAFTYRGLPCRTSMGGSHQIANALTALETAFVLREKGLTIPDAALQEGLYAASIPARIQVLQEDPLVILDGGHNAGGVGALCEALNTGGTDYWVGICGMMDGKDASAAAFQLSSVLSQVLCVDGFADGALPADTLDDYFRREHMHSAPAALEEALPRALEAAREHGGGVVICGSLYLASWYLASLA